jgi:hypothetical protein
MEDEGYNLRIVTRCRIAQLRLRPGSLLTVPADRLRVAAHLCRTGAARPADRRTAIDVELHQRLAAALPLPRS